MSRLLKLSFQFPSGENKKTWNSIINQTKEAMKEFLFDYFMEDIVKSWTNFGSLTKLNVEKVKTYILNIYENFQKLKFLNRKIYKTTYNYIVRFFPGGEEQKIDINVSEIDARYSIRYMFVLLLYIMNRRTIKFFFSLEEKSLSLIDILSAIEFRFYLEINKIRQTLFESFSLYAKHQKVMQSLTIPLEIWDIHNNCIMRQIYHHFEKLEVMTKYQQQFTLYCEKKKITKFDLPFIKIDNPTKTFIYFLLILCIPGDIFPIEVDLRKYLSIFSKNESLLSYRTEKNREYTLEEYWEKCKIYYSKQSTIDIYWISEIHLGHIFLLMILTAMWEEARKYLSEEDFNKIYRFFFSITKKIMELIKNDFIKMPPILILSPHSLERNLSNIPIDAEHFKCYLFDKPTLTNPEPISLRRYKWEDEIIEMNVDANEARIFSCDHVIDLQKFLKRFLHLQKISCPICDETTIPVDQMISYYGKGGGCLDTKDNSQEYFP